MPSNKSFKAHISDACFHLSYVIRSLKEASQTAPSEKVTTGINRSINIVQRLEIWLNRIYENNRD